MVETRKVVQDTQGAFRKPASIICVTGTRYLENIPEGQVRIVQ